MTTASSSPSRDEQPADAGETLAEAESSGRYGMRDLAGDIGEGVKDELLGWAYTGLMWAGIILSWVVPIVGVVLGGISIFVAVRSGRSLIVPVVVAVFSVLAWIVTKSPLGLLPLVLSLL